MVYKYLYVAIFSKQDKGPFSGFFQDLFLIIFVTAFLNVEYIEFYYLAKNTHNGFQF